VTLLDAGKAATLLLVAVVVQVSLVTPIEVVDGHPDLVLVLVTAIALLRGPMLGAVAGFWAGLLLDVAAFGSLGLSSLLLTLGGYWAGRFGEATTRSSPYPPLLAVALGTIWLAVGSAVLHFMLGESVPAGALFGEVLLPTLALNVLVAYPLYRLAVRIFPIPLREQRKVPAIV
jgi:rod shape-determining protein MreD